MESDFWVDLEELCDLGGLVSRQIVEDDMYFALSLVARNQLLQEGDELLAGMAADSLAQNYPRLRVEGGVERKRSMPDVLETASCAKTRPF